MRFVIVGCGSVGAGLAQVLLTNSHDVAVIDTDDRSFQRLGRPFKGSTLVGTGFDRELLIKSGIEKADGLAALTASDETNAVVGRLAREVFMVPKVVARLSDPRKAIIYATLGLETLSPVTWGINRIADMLLYSELHTVAALGTGEVDIVEVEAPALLIGRTVHDVQVPGELHIVAITRHGRTCLPAPDLAFSAGDMMHLAVKSGIADRIKTLLTLR